ncbi:hypothetical protein DPMN_165617 [Dreissena polymorpha]|uniref:Uncharacterized protein n=1 Tax=Dreissena polymorpha TaxID=45954 RepID=A0A9D4EX58_DREPO|nr:hypothetical protein DPMN_165617 [Dreissena polymorpha]
MGAYTEFSYEKEANIPAVILGELYFDQLVPAFCLSHLPHHGQVLTRLGSVHHSKGSEHVHVT